MNVENIKEDNGMYYYNVKGFATIMIELRFFMSNDMRDIIKARLLSLYLCRINAKHGSQKEIRNKLKEYYNMSFGISNSMVGAKRFLILEIELLNHNIIEENYLSEATEFAKDMLFEPKFDGKKLDIEVINQVKKDVINGETTRLSNTNVIASRRLLKDALTNCSINKNLVLDIEEFKNIVNSISDEEIVDFYNEVLKNFYRGFVFGDVSIDEYNTIRKGFPFKSNSDVIDYSEEVIVKEGEETIEDDTIKDSTLDVVYQINNYSLDKWYIYRIIGAMLSHSRGLCNSVLRTEMGLVYSSGSYINKYRFFGFMIVEASISKDNRDKCLDGFREIFNRLKDEEKVSELLEFVKDKFNQDDMVSDESVKNLIAEVEDFVYNERPTRAQLHELTNSVSVQDIIREVSNIEEKFIYFYKGVKDAE